MWDWDVVAVSVGVGRAMRGIHGSMLQWGREATVANQPAVPARTEEVHQMPNFIVELDTYADRARRAAAKRKKEKIEERRRRQSGSEIWVLDTIPMPRAKPKDKGNSD